MKKLLSALVVLALCSSVAMATVPDPTKCTVSPGDALNGLVVAPDSPSPITATVETITVRNSANNPIPNANVVIEYPAPTTIKNCTTALNSGVTGITGQVVLTLRGGGCKTGTGSGLVKANGVVIRTYNAVKSPDWDGAAASGTMTLGDLLSFRVVTPGCHDYNNDGFMNLQDTLIFAAAYTPGHSCTLQP
jgi:hypothetical protein